MVWFIVEGVSSGHSGGCVVWVIVEGACSGS